MHNFCNSTNMERKIIIKFKLKIIIYEQIRREVFSHFFPEFALLSFSSSAFSLLYTTEISTLHTCSVLIIFKETEGAI